MCGVTVQDHTVHQISCSMHEYWPQQHWDIPERRWPGWC